MRTPIRVLPFIVVAALACDYKLVKDSSFFEPVAGSTSTSPTDNTPLVSIGQLPVPGSGPYSITAAQQTLVDQVGPNGVTPSGVNPGSVTATAQGQSLPISHSGDNYIASLGGLTDGPLSILWSGKDNAGNGAQWTQSFYYKTNGPAVGTSVTPSPTMQTSAATAALTLTGTITDPFFKSAVVVITKAGSSGTCSSSSPPADQGTGPGQFQTVSFDITNSVKSSGNGAFSVTATTFNAATTSSAPVTNVDCMVLTTMDAALNGSGAPNPNTTVKTFPVALTWLPTTAAPLTVTTAYTFDPTLKRLCVNVSTSSARAGQTYTGTVIEPGGTTHSFTGVIDATGAGHSTISITQTGLLSGTVTLGTLQQTFSVTIPSSGGTSGSC